jgi:hypothetical protein
MATGLGEQIDRKMVHGWEQEERKEKPWIVLRKRSRTAYMKTTKNRKERHRARINPECVPTYGKYKGWEY